jgi:hypothetical protein
MCGIFSNSCQSSTAPLGLEGELMRTIRVFGVRTASIIAAVTESITLVSLDNTHFPPA